MHPIFKIVGFDQFIADDGFLCRRDYVNSAKHLRGGDFSDALDDVTEEQDHWHHDAKRDAREPPIQFKHRKK